MNQAIRTVNIKGRPYIDVAERVRLCNADEGFSMLKEEYLEIAGSHIMRVYIEVKGKQYIGDAEIKLDARPGSADHDSPISCAQTSSLGRALGFAGYGLLESIASADEVQRNQSLTPLAEIPTVTQLRERVKVMYGEGKWEAVKLKMFKKTVNDEDLQPALCRAFDQALDKEEQRRKEQKAS